MLAFILGGSYYADLFLQIPAFHHQGIVVLLLICDISGCMVLQED